MRLLTKAAAVEAAQNGHNVRINSVHPGVIDTAMTRGMFGEREDETRQKTWSKLADYAPIGRVGEASDIANMILYLASDASSFVTGAEMGRGRRRDVDGVRRRSGTTWKPGTIPSTPPRPCCCG